MAAWTVLTPEIVLARMPTDLVNLYTAWVEANPGKANIIPDLTAQFTEAFRLAAGANPLCRVDPDTTAVPTAAMHHVRNMVYHTIAMEMGVTIAPEVAALFTQATLWLRMAPVASQDLTGTAGSQPEPTPSYAHWNPETEEYE